VPQSADHFNMRIETARKACHHCTFKMQSV